MYIFVSVCKDGSIYLWNTSTGDVISQLSTGKNYTSIASSVYGDAQPLAFTDNHEIQADSTADDRAQQATAEDLLPVPTSSSTPSLSSSSRIYQSVTVGCFDGSLQ